MPLHESGEDYLEAILMISQRQGYVHSVDIAAQLGVTKASVSKAMSALEDQGYVRIVRRDVQLTESGREVAEEIYGRHVFFGDLLVAAGVEPELAAQEGCHMEHTLSEDSFQKLKAYLSEEQEVGESEDVQCGSAEAGDAPAETDGAAEAGVAADGVAAVDGMVGERVGEDAESVA